MEVGEEGEYIYLSLHSHHPFHPRTLRITSLSHHPVPNRPSRLRGRKAPRNQKTLTTRRTGIKMGSDESHFNVSLIVSDKATRHCPQTTTFLKRRESEAESSLGPSAYLSLAGAVTSNNFVATKHSKTPQA